MIWEYNNNNSVKISRKFPVYQNDKDFNTDIGRLIKRILTKDKIAIFGDYDVDGICASIIMKKAFDAIGIKNIVRLPARSEGFGIKDFHIRELKSKGFDTVLTVDNGITAFDAANEAKKIGIDFIITDHHEPKARIPNADIIFDPKLYSRYKEYSGAGVAYLIARQIFRIKNIPLPGSIIQLAGLATVADVVPLDSNNWYIARKGLESMRDNPATGIQQMLDITKRKPQQISGFDLGWIFAPRINAPGRIESPMLSYELLLNGTGAEVVEKINNERLAMVNKYMELVSDNDNKFLIYVFKDCPKGIAGLIAGRSAEKYQKPTLVGSIDADNTVTASVRTSEYCDLMAAFNYALKYVDFNFGGHKSACGLSFNAKDISRLQKVLNKFIEENPIKREINPLDGVLFKKPAIEEIRTFDTFEPFGYKNPLPAFLIGGTITDIKETEKWRMITVNGEFSLFVNGIYKTGDKAKFVISPYINGDYINFKVLDENPEIIAKNTFKEVKVC
jgi:single-stranded-DNA-specific exonuclease